ncbi:MAG: acyl-CoA dehydrogenase family protein [Gammaproteobacteria bacterium]|nr:acyl-CoA dehydrogenase family protein [Gammaproteobacteria bacterium]
MNFELTEEQQLLKDSVQRFLRENYAFDKRRALAASEDGYSQANWQQMAELGWLGVGVPEQYGGLGEGTPGDGAVETMVLMQGIGEGLVLEPFFATVVLGANLIRYAGSAAQCAELLPALVEGRLKLAFAYAEDQSGFDLFDVETSARADGDGWRLNGHKSVVLGAPAADRIIVSARSAGDSRDRDGIGLFLVDPKAQGVRVRGYRNNDDQIAAEVMLDDVRVEPPAVLGDPRGAFAAIEKTSDHAIAALCAEAVGCMRMVVESTNEYLKTREQFGRPIGSFQIMQHRMSNMWIALEECESLMLVATARLGNSDGIERVKTYAGAKWLIGSRAHFIGQSAVQMHGGMGMTDDMAIGHYFKRLTMLDPMFGDHRYHLRLYSELDTTG